MPTTTRRQCNHRALGNLGNCLPPLELSDDSPPLCHQAAQRRSGSFWNTLEVSQLHGQGANGCGCRELDQALARIPSA